LRGVNPRERWQTLQSHLSAARGALATGDRTAALEHIEAALAIDPDFLAARMLRDRVTSPDVETPVLSSIHPDVATRSAATPPMTAAAAAPVLALSVETLASFEERVKQRVRAREAGAARTAVVKRHRRRIATQLAAAAVFLTAISSTALYEPRMLQSRTITMSARLVDLEPPAPIVLDSVSSSPDVATPSVGIPAAPTAVALTAIVNTPPEPVREPPPSVQTTAPQPHVTQPAQQPAPAATQIIAPPPQQLQPVPSPAPRPVQMMPPRPMSDATVAANVIPSSPPAVVPALLVSTVDDHSLVDQTLQRYRRAYNKLDAESAHAVYPAVNESALARAFDSLESQVLSFDSCETSVQGRYATVTCHGTSRYVPKVGNRVTHVEPRIWSFILRKDDEDWKIENARAAGGR
jgi:hypothetical protein